MLREQLAMTTRAKVLVVAAVLVVLGAFVAWQTVGSQEEYLRENKVRIQLEMIADALKSYARRNGRFPSAEEGLNVLAKEGEIKASAFVDPWDQPIGYRCKAADCRIVVVSSKGEVDRAKRPVGSEITIEVDQR